ncbi:GNAT family N-acetyltransferase [Melghirimyces profundicolus]|uniref:GNAT family N-acetyltransferase n=1 Tax=Melghirimyces profundicolus TaxID=1242148 RepID=UPI001FE6CA6A|nr:GNAT family N-acetyltransferase [Melghirimyces profundicolus]
MERKTPPDVSIRSLTSPEELTAVRDLERLIWKNDDPVPIHHTVASVKNGGLVLGAYMDHILVGFQYSFAGFDGKKAYLCSHTLGIHPAYRKQGIGEKLKWAQKKEALEKGYDRIIWTYDPLETVNGYLNLHKLGGTCSVYMVDAYGDMPDELNAGIPSDRLLVEWRIRGGPDAVPFPGREDPPPLPSEQNRLIDTADGVPLGVNLDPEKKAETLFIPVPANFQQIKQQTPEVAKKWRIMVRQAFTHCFQRHWMAVDLIRSQQHKNLCFYVLRKGRS